MSYDEDHYVSEDGFDIDSDDGDGDDDNENDHDDDIKDSDYDDINGDYIDERDIYNE